MVTVPTRWVTISRRWRLAARGGSLPSLRARIAGNYRDAYGISVEAEHVAVTTGSSAGFLLAFLLFCATRATLQAAFPEHTGYITDQASILDPASESALAAIGQRAEYQGYAGGGITVAQEITIN